MHAFESLFHSQNDKITQSLDVSTTAMKFYPICAEGKKKKSDFLSHLIKIYWAVTM